MGEKDVKATAYEFRKPLNIHIVMKRHILSLECVCVWP
jgi:hypothetical protein